MPPEAVGVRVRCPGGRHGCWSSSYLDCMEKRVGGLGNASKEESLTTVLTIPMLESKILEAWPTPSSSRVLLHLLHFEDVSILGLCQFEFGEPDL